jgi:dinuclear metal center YbgI/SA1388 family protein
MVGRDVLENWLHRYLLVPGLGDYTENGLQLAGKDEINRLSTAVSINLEVIERAISARSDAILVHHGLFWNNEERSIRGYRYRRMKRLIENDINVYAYHLPLDYHRDISHNRLILESIHADSIEDPETFLRKRLHGDPVSARIPGGGLVGVFDTEVRFNDLVDRINGALQVRAQSFHFGAERIKTLFVISGAGRNELEHVLGLGVDAFLTGDAKESTPYIVKEEGFNYIYAGHYSTERLGIVKLGEKIREEFGIAVHFIDIENRL